MTQERPPAGGAAANGSPEVPHPPHRGAGPPRRTARPRRRASPGPASDGVGRRRAIVDLVVRRLGEQWDVATAGRGRLRHRARRRRAASGAATPARSATSTSCSCTRAAGTRPRSSRRSRSGSGTRSGTPGSTSTTRSGRSRSAGRWRPRTCPPRSGCSTCSRWPATPLVIARAKSALLEDWRSAARRRLPELLGSTRQRADRHGELAYLIEPELKEARGGIRDAVVLSALAATWLTDRPHGAVDMAYAHLLDVRDTVQVVTRRHTNRLLLADQDEVAALVGFDDRDDLLASIAEAGRVISYALDTTVRNARQALQRPAADRHARARAAHRPAAALDRRGPGRARRRDRAGGRRATRPTTRCCPCGRRRRRRGRA